MADRAYVFAAGRFRGVLSRWGDITSMPISVGVGDQLQVHTPYLGTEGVRVMKPPPSLRIPL